MRRGIVLVAFGLVAATCVDDVTTPSPSPSPAVEQGSGDGWRVMAESPLAPGYGHQGVWTGDEVIVWGGSRLDPKSLAAEPMRDGAAYDPAGDSWRRIPAAPVPAGSGYSVVWTGGEMLIWGDPDRGRRTKGNRGAAYDPETNGWRRIPPGPLPGRSGHLAAWTGEEMIVWGGFLTAYERERYDGRGAAFDPLTDTWRVLPRGPLPAGYDAKGAWTGEELLVMATPMGITADDYPKFDALAAYDTESDSWRKLARPPQVSYVSPPIAFVDGKLGVLSLGGPTGGGKGRETGGVYDYASDRWSPHAAPPERPNQTWEQTAMGGEIVVDGLAYDPASDSWRTLPEFPLREREFPVVVWTGDELIVWGGAKKPLGNVIVDPPPPLNDGAAYTPPVP